MILTIMSQIKQLAVMEGYIALREVVELSQKTQANQISQWNSSQQDPRNTKT